jgi:hypothetical protein
MTGSIFGVESTSFCGYAVKHSAGSSSSGSLGSSAPAIIGVVIGIAALPIIFAILYFTRCLADKRCLYTSSDEPSCFSRRHGLARVVPIDDEESANPPISPNQRNSTGGPPSPVIQFAIVEENHVIADAVVITNPSPVRNRQFPAATPIPTFTSSEVEMFADVH